MSAATYRRIARRTVGITYRPGPPRRRRRQKHKQPGTHSGRLVMLATRVRALSMPRSAWRRVSHLRSRATMTQPPHGIPETAPARRGLIRTIAAWFGMTWHPDDEDSHRREMMMAVALATSGACLVWVPVYAAFGEYRAASIPGGYAMFQRMGLVRQPPNERDFKRSGLPILTRMLRSWSAKQVRVHFDALRKGGLISGERDSRNSAWKYRLPEELSISSSPFRSLPTANEQFSDEETAA